MAIRVQKEFKDISLSFTRHPVTNDLLAIRNEDAVKKSVTNLVRTSIGERFYSVNLGTSVYNSLFELNNSPLILGLEEEIELVIENFEPRVKLLEVIVEPIEDTNELNIQISYEIIGLSVPPQNIEFLLLPSRI